MVSRIMTGGHPSAEKHRALGFHSPWRPDAFFLFLERIRASMKPIPMVGNSYGDLTVLESAGKCKYGTALWLCRCDCDHPNCRGRIIVSGNDLRRKHTKSCGKSTRWRYRKYTLGGPPHRDAFATASTAFNGLLAKYRWRAVEKGLAWGLSIEEFRRLTQGNCYLCGRAPAQVKRSSEGTYVYNGIDRIDSKIGYIVGNCVPCCWRHNSM